MVRGQQEVSSTSVSEKIYKFSFYSKEVEQLWIDSYREIDKKRDKLTEKNWTENKIYIDK